MKKILIFTMILFLCAVVFADTWQINHGNVSDPVRLQKLLTNRFNL